MRKAICPLVSENEHGPIAKASANPLQHPQHLPLSTTMPSAGRRRPKSSNPPIHFDNQKEEILEQEEETPKQPEDPLKQQEDFLKEWEKIFKAQNQRIVSHRSYRSRRLLLQNTKTPDILYRGDSRTTSQRFLS